MFEGASLCEQSRGADGLKAGAPDIHCVRSLDYAREKPLKAHEDGREEAGPHAARRVPETMLAGRGTSSITLKRPPASTISARRNELAHDIYDHSCAQNEARGAARPRQNDALTLGMGAFARRQAGIRALHELREAVTTLVETEPKTARRVLGGRPDHDKN